MTTHRYEIDGTINVAATIAKAQKIAAKATKKGLIGGYTITTETVTSQVAFGHEVKTYLIIEGEPAKYQGWSFVAKVEFINGEPVVTGSRWYSGSQVDRSTLRKNWCDECGKAIARSKVIIVEDEAGQRKQVGTACVKDFLGADVSPTWYDTRDPFSAEFGGYSGGVRVFEVAEVTAAAATIVRQAGFTSRQAAGYDGVATAQIVTTFIGGSPRIEEQIAVQKRFGQITDADRSVAQAAIEWVRGVSDGSDWALNAQAVLTGEFIERQWIGLVVSVVGVYARQQAEAKAGEVKAPAPEGKATVTGIVTAIKSQENQFGPGLVWKFTVKADGGYSVWSTIPASLVDAVEIGDRVEFTATLTRSDRDESFAFAKRPTKATVKAA